MRPDRAAGGAPGAVGLAAGVSACEVRREALWALADGEAGDAAWALVEHRQGCPLCQSRLGELAELQGDMAQQLHSAARRIDTLAALRHIRLRHTLGRTGGLVARLREWVAWHWTFRGAWVWLAAGLAPPLMVLFAWSLRAASPLWR